MKKLSPSVLEAVRRFVKTVDSNVISYVVSDYAHYVYQAMDEDSEMSDDDRDLVRMLVRCVKHNYTRNDYSVETDQYLKSLRNLLT